MTLCVNLPRKAPRTSFLSNLISKDVKKIPPTVEATLIAAIIYI
jgi:hypothetical protein